MTARSLQGMGPVPWPGSLPGPWFLARVLPEAQCQGGRRTFPKETRSALDIEGKHVTIQGHPPGSQLYHRLSSFYPSHRSTSLTLALTMFHELPRRKGPVYDQLTGTPPTGAVKCSCIPRDSRMALTRSTCALPPGAAASRISSRVSGSSVGFLAPAAFLST